MSDRPSVYVSSGIGLILSCVLWHAYANYDGFRRTTTTVDGAEVIEWVLVPEKEDGNE